MASVAQMLNRSNSGHRLILKALSQGLPAAAFLVQPGSSPSKRLGAQTALSTLIGWGAVTSKPFSLTETGHELIEALVKKYGHL